MLEVTRLLVVLLHFKPRRKVRGKRIALENEGINTLTSDQMHEMDSYARCYTGGTRCRLIVPEG